MKRFLLCVSIFLVLIASYYLLSYNSFANPHIFTANIERTDSLNINLIGKWNFGYPFAICTDGNYVYQGSGGGVIIFDISNISDPVKVGDISFPSHHVEDAFVKDTIMFVANQSKGLRVVNISDPHNPIELCHYPSRYTTSVFARNNLVFALEHAEDTIVELTIYDIKDLQEPLILGKDTLPWAHPADVFVKDEYAYIANGQGGLRIIDVSDSTAPFETGYFIPPGYTQIIDICNDTLLLLGTGPVSYQGGIWTVNIKDPYNPYPIGYDTSFECGNDITHFNHYAYVSSYLTGIKVIDFIDPSNPYVIGEFIPPLFSTQDLYHTSVGSTIYACERFGDALRTVDASDPTEPVSIDYDLIPDISTDISVQGDYAYVANCLSGVYILNISNPLDPKDIGHYDTQGKSWRIIANDSIAYVTDSLSIVILNVKDPFNPAKISELPLLCYGNHGLALNFPYLYVTSKKQHQFSIVDVSNPQNPYITGYCILDDTRVTYICRKDSFAFVAASPQGIAIVNIADPFNPFIENYFATPFGIRGMEHKGNYLYAAAGEHSLCILDISDPIHPVLEDTIRTRNQAYEVSISDTLLYVYFLSSGLEIFNISSPLSPQSCAHYCGSPLCYCMGFAVDSGLAYIAAHNGIFIFQHTPSGIKEEEKDVLVKSSMKIMQNPATGNSIRLMLTTTHPNNYDIWLHNILGQEVKVFNLKNLTVGKNHIDLSVDNIPNGVYFLKVKNNQSIPPEKVVILR
jgi:hypothetical protein